MRSVCLGRTLFKLLCLVCFLCLVSCLPHPALVTVPARINYAATLARVKHWEAFNIPTPDFTFRAFGPAPSPTDTLTIYIEGDGLAWTSSETPSANPTPLNPIGLKLALHDKQKAPVVYLARACQFVLDSAWGHCKQADWTHARFSYLIIHATDLAINALKSRYHAKKIKLVGYSGGAAIATLVAARRMDVTRLVTIAGVLDTDAWVREKHLTPLYGSLNPAAAWRSLTAIAQTHWVGGKDAVVPQQVAFAYATRFPASLKPEIKIMPSYDHVCCWTSLAT